MMLLIDIDGVLLHPQPNFRSMMLEDTKWEGDDESFFKKLFADEEYQESLRGRRDFTDFLRRFLPENGNPCTFELFMKWWCHPLIPNIELIDQLTNLNLELSIATNQEKLRSAAVMSQLKPHVELDSVFISHELGVAKPDHAFFSEVLSKINLPPDAVTLIDDSIANIEAAIETGMNAVRFRGNDHVLESLRHMGV